MIIYVVISLVVEQSSLSHVSRVPRSECFQFRRPPKNVMGARQAARDNNSVQLDPYSTVIMSPANNWKLSFSLAEAEAL